MNIENREYFMEAGGESYKLIPCLNDSPEHIEALADLIQLHTQGWPETSVDWSETSVAEEVKTTQSQAAEKGATK